MDSRISPFEKALLLGLGSLWAICFGLSVNSALRHMGYPPVIAKSAPSADGYPTVVGFTSRDMEKHAGLQKGDRLIRFGTADLRGQGPVGMIALAAEQTRSGRRVEILFRRAEKEHRTFLTLGTYTVFLPRLPASIAFMLASLILAFRARPSRMVRAFTWANLCAAFLFACTFAGSGPVNLLSIAVHVVSLAAGAPLAIRGILLFPHGTSPESWPARAGPLLFAAAGPLDASRIYLFPFPREVGLWGIQIVSLAFFVTFLYLTTRAYRRAEPIGRRQIKIHLLGIYIAFAVPMAASAIALVDPSLSQLPVVSAGSLVFIPISLLISIFRYSLFDVDRLIGATASYTLILIAMLAALLTAGPTLAQELSKPVGVEPVTARVGVSILLAAMIIPFTLRLRPMIDRTLFSERYAIGRGIEKLLEEIASCESAERLVSLLGERLDELIRPESCAIYARGPEIFSPVFASGRALPPMFETRGPLIATLETRSTALAAGNLSRRRGGMVLSPFDRAALETLGVPVVLPIRRGTELVAFVSLGPKRSGDIYTPTDLTLLTAVSQRASSQLMNFDQMELTRQSLAMQEALRRYVPGAIADELANGRDLEIGEREVTVLFVDIRGYTGYAEGREASEVFSTVNRYTRTVSELVHQRGGNVLEFHGDGVMAVFGVPKKLEHKERRAVEAGAEIIRAVEALGLPTGDPRRETPSVGIGIATGAAFVGSVQAADRFLWTAIGTTTNLAARLQALTRELDAAMVIDASTWKRAGPLAHHFEKREAAPIRGLRATKDLFLLPYATPKTTLSESLG